jgi:cell division protein FtsI/penicillin-binding protein 2
MILLLIGYAGSATDLHLDVAPIMQGRSGTAVVVDVISGQVVAAYHPAIAARRLALPGSAFKPFTLLALLQSKKLTSTEPFVCRRRLRIGSHDLSCSHPQNGPLEAESALAYSCNDFFATLGLRLSAAEIEMAFKSAGFGSPSGFAADEAVGEISRARTDEERELQAVGEWGMRVTPLEMLSAYRSLALRRRSGGTAEEEIVFSGLEQATSYGVARLASAPEVRVAGKTGTPRSATGGWNNAWFAGYAPSDKPEVAVVVFLERGTGPSDAAPLAGKIFRAWYQARP